jgi:hypothetical protein
MRKSAAAISIAVGALTFSGALAHADTQSPAPTPPFGTPKCLTFDGQPPQLNWLPCGWTTDGKRWTPPPPQPTGNLHTNRLSPLAIAEIDLAPASRQQPYDRARSPEKPQQSQSQAQELDRAKRIVASRQSRHQHSPAATTSTPRTTSPYYRWSPTPPANAEPSGTHGTSGGKGVADVGARYTAPPSPSAPPTSTPTSSPIPATAPDHPRATASSRRTPRCHRIG